MRVQRVQHFFRHVVFQVVLQSGHALGGSVTGRVGVTGHVRHRLLTALHKPQKVAVGRLVAEYPFDFLPNGRSACIQHRPVDLQPVFGCSQ